MKKTSCGCWSEAICANNGREAPAVTVPAWDRGTGSACVRAGRRGRRPLRGGGRRRVARARIAVVVAGRSRGCGHRLRDRELAAGRLGRPSRRNRRRCCRRAGRAPDRPRCAPARRDAGRHRGCSSRALRSSSPRWPGSRSSATSRRSRCPLSPRGSGGRSPSGTPVCGHSRGTSKPRRMPRKLVLVVVDGMTPAAFERAVDSGRAPALAFLAEHGDYRKATSVFPSLTPVCLTSIATGAGPGVHHIPSLVWWDRQERRIVEYGSSFAAAARRRALAVAGRHDLQHERAAPLEGRDHGLRGARGRRARRGRGEHHVLPRPAPLPAGAAGPEPRRARAAALLLLRALRVGPDGSALRRSQPSRRLDRRVCAAVGRWLVTRDGFDFLAYYLSGYDFASHAAGPHGEAAERALEQADAAIRALLDAAGGPDQFLERYAVVLLSDHGQTRGRSRRRGCRSRSRISTARSS